MLSYSYLSFTCLSINKKKNDLHNCLIYQNAFTLTLINKHWDNFSCFRLGFWFFSRFSLQVKKKANEIRTFLSKQHSMYLWFIYGNLCVNINWAKVYLNANYSNKQFKVLIQTYSLKKYFYILNFLINIFYPLI